MTTAKLHCDAVFDVSSEVDAQPRPNGMQATDTGQPRPPMIAYGPVPSRRLGRSLGINNIPPKVCTYSCVYCQLGRTMAMRAQRQAFYAPEEIVHAVQRKVAQAKAAGERIDYLTFVPDGEPTLDRNLGKTIDLLRPLAIPIAVISNASLMGRQDVRQELMKADWVSLKVDAVRDEIWRKISRPHRSLHLDTILAGIRQFAQDYRGTLVTETMLVAGVNDGAAHLAEVADFLSYLRLATAYLAIPTRPPAEEWVRAPDQDAVNRAFQIFCDRLTQVEYLIGYEGNAFAYTGNVEEDLLSISAVHPLREEAVRGLLSRAGAGWHVVRRLLDQGELIATEYQGQTFYMRKLRTPETI